MTTTKFSFHFQKEIALGGMNWSREWKGGCYWRNWRNSNKMWIATILCCNCIPSLKYLFSSFLPQKNHLLWSFHIWLLVTSFPFFCSISFPLYSQCPFTFLESESPAAKYVHPFLLIHASFFDCGYLFFLFFKVSYSISKVTFPVSIFSLSHFLLLPSPRNVFQKRKLLLVLIIFLFN